MSQRPLATLVFALIGTALLLIAVVLGLLGSFAFIAIAAVGCFFIAAALIARASRSPSQRAAGVMSVVGLALVVFGLVATPLFYLGWACLGAGLIGLAGTVALRGDSKDDAGSQRRPISWLGRALLYLAAGLGVGFLFLAEFAFSTVALVQVVIAVLGVVGLVGGLRRMPNLSIWSMFVLGALLFPLLVDSRAFLPLCSDVVGSGTACIARDYRAQFLVELVSFLASCFGALLYLRMGLNQSIRSSER